VFLIFSSKGSFEPEDVKKFIKETGVDALAVSIGTAHGVYESEPELNIERLKKINEVSSVPLVLHGGSGTPKDQLQKSIKNGLTDFNFYEVELKKKMVEKSDRLIAVLDHTKIGHTSAAQFAAAEEIDLLITDSKISENDVKEIKNAGVDIITGD